MTKETYARLTLLFSCIAAGLALSAPLLEYSRSGDMNVAMIAAAFFILAFGLGAAIRMRRR